MPSVCYVMVQVQCYFVFSIVKKILKIFLYFYQGSPLTYFYDGRGGGASDFLDLQFWPKVIYFGCMRDTRIFFGWQKKTDRGIFLGFEKRTKGFFGVC